MIPVWYPESVTTDLDRAITYALLWGVEGLVLRSVGRDQVPYVNQEKVRRRAEENELPIIAVEPGLFEGSPAERSVWLNDVVEIEEAATFCSRLSCGFVILGPLAEEPHDEQAARDAVFRAGGRGTA